MKRKHIDVSETSGLEQTPCLRDLARIVAQGFLRLSQQGHLPTNTNNYPLENALNYFPQDLEQNANSRLSVI